MTYIQQLNSSDDHNVNITSIFCALKDVRELLWNSNLSRALLAIETWHEIFLRGAVSAALNSVA